MATSVNVKIANSPGRQGVTGIRSCDRVTWYVILKWRFIEKFVKFVWKYLSVTRCVQNQK
jgi:hypothetical protein